MHRLSGRDLASRTGLRKSGGENGLHLVDARLARKARWSVELARSRPRRQRGVAGWKVEVGKSAENGSEGERGSSWYLASAHPSTDKVAHVAPRGYFFLFFSLFFSFLFSPPLLFPPVGNSLSLSISNRVRCDTRSKSIEDNENSTSRKRSGPPPRRKLEASSLLPSLCPISLRLNRPSLQSPTSHHPSFSHSPFLSLSRARNTHELLSLSLRLTRREPHNTRVPNLVDTLSSTPTPRPLSSRLFSRVYHSCLVHRETNEFLLLSLSRRLLLSYSR